MNKRTIVLLLVCIILGFISGWLIRKRTAEPVVTDTQIDTVYIEKKVSIDNPAPVSSAPAPPVLVPRDSVRKTADSTMLSVAATTKTYRDTLETVAIEAIVSGVEPKVDRVSVTYLAPLVTTTRTIVKPFQGWKMSVSSNNAIYTQALQSQNCIEFSYTTGPFVFGLQAGAMVTKPFPGEVRVDPYLGGRLTFDILKFQ